MTNHYNWLKTCPPNDMNFRIHLGLASEEDIKQVLSELPEQGNKTKIRLLKAELKRRNRNEKIETENP